MYDPTVVLQLIEETVPELHDSMQDPATSNCLYKQLQAFTDYTCEKAAANDTTVLKRCLQLAGRLHAKGTKRVRSAVENVFVYSISRMLLHAKDCRETLKKLMPARLQAAYMQQVLHRSN